MRILFTTFPALGHFHPIAPLALSALERGDEVVVASGGELASWISACGLPAVTAGLDDVHAEAESRARFDGPMRVFHMFTSVVVPPMLRDLLAFAAGWRPQLVIHEEAEYAAPLAAHLLGLPCITHSWASPARPPDQRKVFRDLLEPIWSEHGAVDVRDTGMVYLDACPPMFQTEAIDSITGVRPIQALPFDGPPTPPPPWLDKIEHPAAYVSLGTVPRFARAEAIQSTVDAVYGLVATTVVTTGPNPADKIAPPATSVLIEPYVPQSLVLPHVEVVVSHGGAGTTLGALRHGLPHVVLPQGAPSQLRSAQRVEALGIGIHVNDGSDDSLKSAVHKVLDDPKYMKKVRRVRESLLELPSPETVLSQLAELKP